MPTRCFEFRKRQKNNSKGEIISRIQKTTWAGPKGTARNQSSLENKLDELPINKAGSLPKLRLLLKKLKKNPMQFEHYDEIIRDQLTQGMVERIPNGHPNKREFYVPHISVIREIAECTKVRIVFMQQLHKTIIAYLGTSWKKDLHCRITYDMFW